MSPDNAQGHSQDQVPVNTQANAPLSPLKRAYLALEDLQARLDAAETSRREPVAIVGIGCRLPGEADSPEAFWQLLRNGRDAITAVPRDRWDVDEYYDPDPDRPGKTSSRWGGFVQGVDRFDARFFGVAGREAASMDPQQRLLLRTAWEALEDAGQNPAGLAGSRTGAFIAITTGDYGALQLQSGGLAEIDTYYASGNAHSIASGRLSYVLGLQGPSLSLDTACSSSLVATHLAVASLRARESNLALAGGVNLILSPDNTVALSRYHMMAADGRCKAFDAAADGFVRGEGCGVIVLKRLADALADGDRIYAVIRGTAANQDGASSGLTAPNGPSQEAVIRDALANGGVAPHEVGYVEAHGTGTSLGDPIEVRALAAVLGEGRSEPLAIGSVKTNIGHLEAVAGIAGLIKAALCVYHGEIPPTLHFKTPNPHIDWEAIPVVVPTQLVPWQPQAGRRVAGVSSFGFSGTNVHVVMEQAPERPARAGGAERHWQILTVSAKGAAAFDAAAGRMEQHLAAHGDALNAGGDELFADWCHTANAGRAHFEHRLAIVAHSPAQALERMAAAARGETGTGLARATLQQPDPLKVAFLFTGQGSQYAGMGKRLYETQPLFRETLDRCDAVLRERLGESLRAIMFDSPERLNETAFTQPALFALEYALAAVWRSWGIEPAAVMGHSVGEYVAATLAGVFSLEDGLGLIAERGRLMQALPRGGVMAAVFAGSERVAEALRDWSDTVSIAAVNGPDNTVISGAEEAVGSVTQALKAGGLTVRKLNVSHAFHSPLMDPILDEFERTVARVRLSAPRLRLISNVTGDASADVTTPAYWRRHVRSAVQFAASIESIRAQGIDTFIEIGPGTTLLGLGQRCAGDGVGLWVPSLRQGQDDWQPMLAGLAELYVNGAAVNWSALDPRRERRKVSLPTYPFQEERHWFRRTAPASAAASIRAGASVDASVSKDTNHPLLGRRLRSPLKQIQFESELSTQTLGFLNDHRVGGHAILPATGFLEMALAAARRALPALPVVQELAVSEPLRVDDGARTCQLVLEPDGEFRVVSMQGGDEWTLHATGKLAATAATAVRPSLDRSAIEARCSEVLAADAHYGVLAERGLDLGPSLHGVRSIRYRQGEALGEIVLPDAVWGEVAAYYIHPALLDACLQVVAATRPGSANTYLPIHVESFELDRVPGPALTSHVTLRPSTDEALTADVELYDRAGASIGRVTGLVLRRIDAQRLAGDSTRDWMYEVQWLAQALPATVDQAPPAAAILADVVNLARREMPESVRRHGLAGYVYLDRELDNVCAAFITHSLSQLGWKMTPGARVALPALARELGVLPAFDGFVRRGLDILAEDGILGRAGDEWLVLRAPEPVDPQARLAELAAAYPQGEAKLQLLGNTGPQLAQVLRGRVDPLALLFPDGSTEVAQGLYHDSAAAQVYNSMVARLVSEWVARFPGNRKVRILELGAGTGGTTAFVLPQLPAGRVEYTFTDLSPAFTTRAQRTFEPYSFVRYRKLDIEQDPVAQGVPAHSVDIVIATNVIHATADLRKTLAHVRRTLAPDGVLILVEINKRVRWVDLTFGLTEGWWRFTDHDLRADYPLLSQNRWMDLLTDCGFVEPAALPRVTGEVDVAPSLLGEQSIIAALEPSVERDGVWCVLADEGGLADRLIAELGAEVCVRAIPGTAYGRVGDTWSVDPSRPEDFERWLREAIGDATCRGVIHLWNLDGDSGSHRSANSVVSLVQALVRQPAPPRLWLVTRGAQPVDGPDVSPAQALVWGLGRTIMLEHPELNCTLIDLGMAVTSGDASHLAREIRAVSDETQVAWRGEMRRVARLERLVARPHTPQNLVITERGALDHLDLRPQTRRSPGPGQVEIAVRATGLNFKDVMNVLGMYPGDPGPLGGECAGVVVATDEGVTHLKVGDEVIALAPGSFSSFVTTGVEFVVPKPPALSFAQAATIPIAFVTADYALRRTARLGAGERVLIHAAAGGVGLAAVQVAQRAGAEVYATAGSAEKRAHLQSLGVAHVYDSRTLDFGPEIMADTGGAGVDVVLNSLSGDFISRSLAVLAGHGRYVEIGKSGLLSDAQAKALGRGIEYHIVDWSETARREPAVIRTLLAENVAAVAAGALAPLPYRSFPLAAAVEAFRYMAQAKHTGKIVVMHDHPASIRSDGTYLITGGLGGLGLVTARWLVERGARHLVLMGRHGLVDAARPAVDELERLGCRVVVAQGDVSRREDIARVIGDLRQKMPPLRGILHAAGVLDDAALVYQNEAHMQAVLAPKVEGTLHLDALTRDLPLDLFVLYSSVAAIEGAPGQANHAAANAFMDAFAFRRRALGLPGLSINWGVWSEVGKATHGSVQARAAELGLGTIAPAQGLQVLEQLIVDDVTQAVVMPIQRARFKRSSPLMRDLARTTPAAAAAVAGPAVPPPAPRESDWTRRLQAAPVPKRLALLQAFVREQAGRVLGVDSAQVADAVPLKDMGLDSLMAVELRNRLGSELGLPRKLPATLVFDYPTVHALAAYLVPELFGTGKIEGTPERTPASNGDAVGGVVASIEELSDAEVDALFAQKGLSG